VNFNTLREHVRLVAALWRAGFDSNLCISRAVKLYVGRVRDVSPLGFGERV